jgi:hypothetical protein
LATQIPTPKPIPTFAKIQSCASVSSTITEVCIQTQAKGLMATKYLRPNGFILQFVRYASSGGSQTQASGRRRTERVVTQAMEFRPGNDKGGKLSSRPIKPTYEPSPIFGAVKPTSKESLKQPISNLKQPILSPKGKPEEEVKPKKPLTEDEKMVCKISIYLPILTNSTRIKASN